MDENTNLTIPSGLSTLTSGYMDYVKYVIFDRALVNIDGLKPSQRRILTTMYEIEKAKNLTKCATIVGSTLKLHPHGDCLRGNTKIKGLDGKTYTIKELYESGTGSLEILAYNQSNGNLEPAKAHSFRIGQYTDKVYHVKFYNGGEVCVTSNHPFLIKTKQGVSWVKAENLTTDMQVVSYSKDYIITQTAILSIDIEVVDSEPMYDFTVDVYENMFIPLEDTDVFICVHNSAVYGTLCRMMDSAGFWNVPIIRGKGSFQRSYTSAPSSASRYTECCLREESSLYFDDLAGINRVPNYDNSRTEPELLPVKFPSILCNASSGIAVGIASNIPSFNFHEVLDATIEIIKTGDLKKPIAPDFSGGTFGGEYVWNETELWSIMRNGRGTLRLRGKWVIDKKTITITEIPFYTTEEAIKKVADNIPEVRSCTSLTDINGMEIQIECMNTQCVEQVLQQLIFESDLQMNVKANIVAIVDNVPKRLGVIDLIKEWVKFRKGVLTKMFKERRDALQYEVERNRAFVKVVSDPEIKMQLVNALSGVSEDNVEVVLAKIIPGVDRSIYTWIADKKIRSLASPARAQSALANAEAELAQIDKYLSNLDAYIVDELTSLNKRYKYPRKTEITSIDYNQVKGEEEVFDAHVVLSDKFVTKVHDVGQAGGIKCKSDDVLIIMDTLGRVIKLPLKDVPETSTKSVGTYIPTVLKIKDDFQIVNVALCEDKTEAFLYNDGCLSVMDYSEWVGNKRGKRVIANGYSGADCIFSKFDTSVPYCFIMTNLNRLAIMPTEFIKKGRTARTRFLKLKPSEVINSYIPSTQENLPIICPMFTKYMGKLVPVETEDFNVSLFNKLENNAKADYWFKLKKVKK